MTTSNSQSCPTCGGRGEYNYFQSESATAMQCPDCRGTGKTPSEGMGKSLTTAEAKAELMKDPEFKAAYDAPSEDWDDRPIAQAEAIKRIMQGWKPGWICGKHHAPHERDCGYTGFTPPAPPQAEPVNNKESVMCPNCPGLNVYWTNGVCSICGGPQPGPIAQAGEAECRCGHDATQHYDLTDDASCGICECPLFTLLTVPQAEGDALMEILTQARMSYALSSGNIFNPADSVCMNLEREAHAKLTRYIEGIRIEELAWPAEVVDSYPKGYGSTKIRQRMAELAEQRARLKETNHE